MNAGYWFTAVLFVSFSLPIPLHSSLPFSFVSPPYRIIPKSLTPAENPNSECFQGRSSPNKYNLGEEPPSPPRQGALGFLFWADVATSVYTENTTIHRPHSLSFLLFSLNFRLCSSHMCHPDHKYLRQRQLWGQISNNFCSRAFHVVLNPQHWPSGVLFGDYSLSSQSFPFDFWITFRYKPNLNVGILRPHQVYFMVPPLPLHINIHIHMFLYKHTHVWI